MTSIVGPMGFTDMDHEGLLIEGFDEMGTMATIYNYPYYSRHLENLGFKKISTGSNTESQSLLQYPKNMLGYLKL